MNDSNLFGEKEINKIPVISLHQPWGNWVSLGWKTIETRTHKRLSCLNGKTIGIHLALKWDSKWIDNAWNYLSENQIERTKRFLKIGGAIICVADVTGFRALNNDDSQKSLIECNSLRYGLILNNIHRIEAIPCKGGQGIFYNKELDIIADELMNVKQI